MRNARAKYRQFLKSSFWIDLSNRKKLQVGKCEKCGSTDQLQSHHKVYRLNWFETKLEDLQVLCRHCHREEHGIAVTNWGRIINFRDDPQFSRFIYFMIYLQQAMVRTGRQLRQREKWYLQKALELYPPKPNDGCMRFHVEQTLKMSEMAPTFYNP